MPQPDQAVFLQDVVAQVLLIVFRSRLEQPAQRERVDGKVGRHHLPVSFNRLLEGSPGQAGLFEHFKAGILLSYILPYFLTMSDIYLTLRVAW